MSDLIERVAKAIEHTGWGLQAEDKARAAIAVVLKDMRNKARIGMAAEIERYARENGVSLDE